MSNNYVERMKDEHKQLEVKIKALNSFIHGNEKFKTLGDIEQARMIKQAGFMEAYAETLSSRIWANQ